MKRSFTLAVCICLALLVALSVLTVQAAENQFDFEYSVIDGSLTVTKYISDKPNAVVPDSIDGMPVTAIASEAFKGNQTLKSVTVPDSVFSIGNSAFRGCSSLEVVELGDGVREIGDYAFYDCHVLAHIDLPSGLIDIGSSAFRYCYALREITIPETVCTIGNDAFNDCRLLEYVKLDANLSGGYDTSSKLFYTDSDNSDGFTLVIGKGVSEIPDYAFYQAAVRELVFEADSQCRSIGAYAFGLCEKLQKIEIPESVFAVGDGAFYNCTEICDIEFNAASMSNAGEKNKIFNKVGQNGDGIRLFIGESVLRIPDHLFCP